MQNLEQILESIKGAKIVTLRTKTKPKIRKTSKINGLPCPYAIVERECLRNGIIGVNYESAVNNQRQREGHEEEFKAQLLWKGKGRHVGKYLIEHVDTLKRYIAFMAKITKGVPVIVGDKWYADGKEITKEELEEFLPDIKENLTQETEKQIAWRTIELDNILEVKGLPND